MDALGCGLPACGARPPSLQRRSAVAVAGSQRLCAVRGRTAVGGRQWTVAASGLGAPAAARFRAAARQLG
jgi:hypothetical protein